MSLSWSKENYPRLPAQRVREALEKAAVLVNSAQGKVEAQLKSYPNGIHHLPDFLLDKEPFFITASCPSAPDPSQTEENIFLFVRYGDDGSWAHLSIGEESSDEIAEFLFGTIREKFPDLPWSTLGLLSRTEIS